MFSPIVVKNSWVPKLSIGTKARAITIGLFIFVATGYDKYELLMNHESIHVKQWVETLFIGFLLLYPLLFLVNLVRYRDTRVAYLLNPFEVEARVHASRPEMRKFYGWLRGR